MFLTWITARNPKFIIDYFGLNAQGELLFGKYEIAVKMPKHVYFTKTELFSGFHCA
jgi:hypothetical protein